MSREHQVLIPEEYKQAASDAADRLNVVHKQEVITTPTDRIFEAHTTEHLERFLTLLATYINGRNHNINVHHWVQSTQS